MVGSREKWSDLGYILEVDSTGFLMELTLALGKGGMNPKFLACTTGCMLDLLTWGSLCKEQGENQEFYFGLDAFQLPPGYPSGSSLHR